MKFDVQQLEETSCTVAELRVEESSSSIFSPIYIYGIPVVETISLPSYEPSPSCGFTGQDVTYRLAEGYAIPAWLIFDESERTVTVDTASHENLAGKETAFKFQASFSQLIYPISFKVRFTVEEEVIEKVIDKTIDQNEQEVKSVVIETEPAVEEKDEEDEPVNKFDLDFDPEPLGESLTAGIGEFFAKITRMKELARDAAAESSSEGGPRPPEIRIGQITSNRRV